MVKGDFTRDTFRARRHYWGVLRQQGRVDLDADWNEQIRIARHDQLRRTADLIGQAGGPQGSAGFELAVDAGGELSIGAGRYYVAGVLCENDDPVDFEGQPDLDPSAELPEDAGLHLAYLDVWDRHVTAHGDPVLREVALGGPDTATRAATAWQVRTAPLAPLSPELNAAIAALVAAREADDEDAEAAALQDLKGLAEAALCADPLEPLGGSLEPGTGTMAARAAQDADAASDPCRFEPQGGYRRLENRLYRVEVHDGGPRADASFKWSRDNGSLAFSIEEFVTGGGAPATTTRVRVRRLGFDAVRSLRRDDWVEITGDDDERAGRPGTLVQITNEPDAAERILELSDPVPIWTLDQHPVVRRWDMPADGGPMQLRTTWQELEDGVQVRFAAGTYHTGDYWLIPARTNTADVEWPPFPTYPGETVAGAPSQLPPMGVEHRLAPLAVLVHGGAAGLLAAIDQRRLFPPATRHTALFQLGGDGQEPEPDGRIPQPLQVGVANGEQPVEGVLVRFEVVHPGDILDAGGGAATEVTVATDADGVASVEWTLDLDEVDHRVVARLLDSCENEIHLPVFFNAHVDYALHYLSGDGQEGMVGDGLQPLRVWVAHGRRPAGNATVAFTVESGGGSLSAGEVATNEHGIAQVAWTLGDEAHRQQVRAVLLDGPGGDPVHEADVIFNANLSLASEVAYGPAEECEVLAEATTVQDALDQLCARISYNLQYLSGDGQEVGPGETLAPLRVWVSDGRFPLEDATVAFRITDGAGTLSDDEVQTGADGIAEVQWTLDGSTPRQQVEATFLDEPGGEAVHEATVRFNAFLSRADRVGYTPTGDCATLVGATTVQDALDRLCLAGPGAEPGFRIRDVLVGADPTTAPLQNDGLVPADLLARGIRIRCDGTPDPAAVEGKPVCDVTLELPWPFSPQEMEFYAGNSDLIGFRPIRLAGHANTSENTIEWMPENGPTRWIVERLFPLMDEMGRGDRILARLILRGHVIWSLEDRDVYLDGDAFGGPGAAGRTELRLDEGSGDGRRGGDFQLWFWLVRPQGQRALRIEAGASMNSITGRVTDSLGAPAAGARVTLADAAGNRATIIANADGLFIFQSVIPGTYQLTAESPDFIPATMSITVTGGTLSLPQDDFLGVALRDVTGIGEATEGRLRTAGVNHPAELVVMEPEELAERGDFTLNQADTLIRSARILFQ